MTCPVCNRDDLAYLRCNRPDCTDGRRVPGPKPAPLSIEFNGKPLTEELSMVFGAWGVAKSVVISDQSGIVVGYADGAVIKFVPIVGKF